VANGCSRVAARRGLKVLRLGGLSALIAAQMWPAAALAEVRLSGEAGANYQVSVMSWWEIPFRSVVRQQYDFSCGSAAVATLLTYHYGRPTKEQFAFARMWDAGDQAAIRKAGFSMLDMKNLLGNIGYRAEGFRLSVDELVKLNRPGIVLLDLKGYKHFVVVKGAKNGNILVGDPMIGLGQYTKADFAKAWNGIMLSIVATPSEAKPKFNLASDWGPWSSAPMDNAELRVSAGNLTTHLPPEYQINSGVLFDLRTGTLTP
jgi:predicted double-glycine peptidase